MGIRRLVSWFTSFPIDNVRRIERCIEGAWAVVALGTVMAPMFTTPVIWDARAVVWVVIGEALVGFFALLSLMALHQLVHNHLVDRCRTNAAA